MAAASEVSALRAALGERPEATARAAFTPSSAAPSSAWLMNATGIPAEASAPSWLDRVVRTPATRPAIRSATFGASFAWKRIGRSPKLSKVSTQRRIWSSRFTETMTAASPAMARRIGSRSGSTDGRFGMPFGARARSAFSGIRTGRAATLYSEDTWVRSMVSVRSPAHLASPRR